MEVVVFSEYMLPATYLVANNATAPICVMAHGYLWKDLVWTQEEAPIYSQDLWSNVEFEWLCRRESLLELRSIARWFERKAILQSGALVSEL
jgi:ABC-type uncharacterized transport system involved in gliding motility auxiliary subunit